MAVESVMAAGKLRIPGEVEEGILIGDSRYSGVLLTLDNCLLPDERLTRSPSAEQGLPADVEEQLRKQGCELIQAAGILLRLPQTVAMACVHLASKIEEEPRRIRDVINVFHRLKQGQEDRVPTPLLLDSNYVSMKNQVIVAERRVLKELGFCVHVKHPHKVIVMYLQVLECEKNTQLVQTAWNYMNDSLRTDVFLRFSAETVACACIFLAARSLQVPLPTCPPWFLLFGASEEDLKEICCRILRLYLLPPVPLSSLQEHVTRCRQALDAVRTKATLTGTTLLPNGTPTLEVPSSFSPTSKPNSPGVTQVSRDSPRSQMALKGVCRNLASGKSRQSHSDDRRERLHTPPSRSPKRRRSRSVSSPAHSLSPSHRRKEHSDHQRERERRRERRRNDRQTSHRR